MSERGIDVSNQRAKIITEEMIERNDKIYVMCEKEGCPKFLLDSNKVTFWDVKDPHYMTLDKMREIRDTIEEKVLSIVGL